MNPVSDTAYYCCGVRMEDAEKESSVCNDQYAKKFMDARALDIFEPFKSVKGSNVSTITRCRIIDDYIREELEKNSDTMVVTIGAGFDTRPYRIAGGFWVEVDEAQIVEYKNEKLAVETCGNSLQRIAIDFSNESLVDKLAAIADSRPVLVVIEGVLMYLDETSILNTIRAVQRLCPNHTLICDLMTKTFFEKYSARLHSKIQGLGSVFTQRPDNPEHIFLDNGYEKLARVSIYQKAAKLGLLKATYGAPKIVSWLLANVFMKDVNGNAVFYFRYANSG